MVGLVSCPIPLLSLQTLFSKKIKDQKIELEFKMISLKYGVNIWIPGGWLNFMP